MITVSYFLSSDLFQNHILVNEEMVTHNYAKWIDELDQQYFYSDGVAAYSSEIDQLSHNLGEWVTLSPDLMTVIPTEQYSLTNATTANETATASASATVPETDETQTCQEAHSSTSANDSVNNITTVEATATADTSVLSWADEMEKMSNEELLVNNDLTESMTVVKRKEKNSRRKKKH